MGSDENQRQAFKFLSERLESQEPFTKEEFEKTTTWQGKSFSTYWSKQYRQFVVAAPNNRFRVSEAFRPYTDWDKFRDHVTQVRRVASDYKKESYENVLVFEFFMPLTNEPHLRTTLDALFFRDTILARLRTQDDSQLYAHFPKKEGEPKESYLNRLCDWIAPRFVGYSISHVNGRFRAQRLSTREEAANPPPGKRYLVDETTAVTRFIFPCKDKDDAGRIRWFFNILFVDSIIQVVNGEDEIWMIESGMQNQVYIWRIDRTEVPDAPDNGSPMAPRQQSQ